MRTLCAMTHGIFRLLSQLIRASDMRAEIQSAAVRLRSSRGYAPPVPQAVIIEYLARSFPRTPGSMDRVQQLLQRPLSAEGACVRPAGRKRRGARRQVPGPHAVHRWVGRRRKGAPEVHRRGAVLAASGPCARASAVNSMRACCCAEEGSPAPDARMPAARAKALSRASIFERAHPSEVPAALNSIGVKAAKADSWR